MNRLFSPLCAVTLILVLGFSACTQEDIPRGPAGPGVLSDGGAADTTDTADTTECADGTCADACVPACAGKECGEDGCGGSCGVCPEGAPVCGDSGLCQLPPTPDALSDNLDPGDDAGENLEDSGPDDETSEEVLEDAGPDGSEDVVEDVPGEVAEPPPDVTDEPDSEPAEAACITPEDGAWTMTGEAYCATLGLLCTWVDYFEGGGPCTGDAYSGCWGSSPLSCCLSPMSGHAGSPAGASALWYCGDACPEGSELANETCVDIDECTLPEPVCGQNATCTNTVGAYKCLCDEGYTGDGQDCELTDAYYPGCITSGDDAWTLTGEAYCASFGLQCTWVDYYGSGAPCTGDPYSGCWGSNPLSCCKSPMSGHAGYPKDASATWHCGEDCPGGSELVNETCVDIDECALPEPVCGQDATCNNKVGAYVCLCDLGFSGDGQICAPVEDAPGCITSGDAAWSLNGDAYCGDFGMTCTGTAYYGSSPSCEGDPYTGCWGGDIASCCGASMAGHAGSPEGTSATWTCTP